MIVLVYLQNRGALIETLVKLKESPNTRIKDAALNVVFLVVDKDRRIHDGTVNIVYIELASHGVTDLSRSNLLTFVTFSVCHRQKCSPVFF